MKRVIEIYIPVDNLREIKFSFEFLFEHVADVEWNIKESLGNNVEIIFNDKKIVFNQHYLTSSFNKMIIPERLIEFDNLVGFFGTKKLIESDKEIVFDFDFLGTVFYKLSMVEECQLSKLSSETHGRIPYELLCANKFGIYQRAILDEYRDYLLNKISTFFNIEINEDIVFKQIFTSDIDIHFKYNSFFGKIKFAVKSLINLKINLFINILISFYNKKKFIELDPIANFPKEISKYLHRYNETFFFVLLKTANHPLDFSEKKDLSYFNFLKDFVANQNTHLGIHPSYLTFNNKDLLKSETEEFYKDFKMRANYSRQHFLRVSYPQTFLDLEQNGITDDFSGGVFNKNGFLFGTCRPFYFFDNSIKRKSKLLLRPLIFMDATSFDYRNADIKSIEEEFLLLRGVCQKYKGEFVFLIHNYYYSLYKEFFEMLLLKI